ncbi:MAG: hypothetical protein H7177_00715 [Rhizobacter sp.]|nr:hypothetical protein [Bacteriovorax sp.]
MKTFNILFFSLLFSTTVHASDIQINNLKTDLPSGQYEATTYQPTDRDIKAILILTPTIAGVSLMEKANAHYFSKAGFLVIMPLPYDDEITSTQPDIAKLDEGFIRPALAVDSFIEISEKQFHLPANLPVFAMGASQGGIRTLIITSHSPRITAAWFATAGGDFASIYARSTVKKIATFRENHMKFLGLTKVSDYETYLRNNLKNDPAIACKDIKVPFVQTIALKDDKVPTENQELLVKNCPAHKVIRIDTGHVGGSLTTLKWRKQIKTFFLNSI